MILFRYFLIAYSAILFVAYVVLGVTLNMAPVSYLYILMANIYMVICSRHNFMPFIVAFILLFCNYSIIYANYIGMIQNVFTTNLSAESYIISLNVLTLFNVFLFLFVRWERVSILNKVEFVDANRGDNFILYLLYSLLIPIFFLGFTLPEAEGQRGAHSTAYEYSAIPFMLLFYYSGNQKWHIRFGLMLVAIYSLQSFVFGGRIEAIQFILVAYMMLFIHRISMPKVIIAMVGMFFLMSIIGVVRGELLSGNADVSSILSSLAESGFALDTAYSAYYTSESFVYIIDKFTLFEIIALFCEFVKSIFLGANPDVLLTSISAQYTIHYGGGILPFYFFFYLGAIGVFVASVLAAFYLNKVIGLQADSSGYMKCLTVWIVSTTFRWYLYTPLPLLRGVLFLTIAYFSFAYLHHLSGRIFVRKETEFLQYKE